jgi:hypothetical protein
VVKSISVLGLNAEGAPDRSPAIAGWSEAEPQEMHKKIDQASQEMTMEVLEPLEGRCLQRPMHGKANLVIIWRKTAGAASNSPPDTPEASAHFQGGTEVPFSLQVAPAK